MANPSKEDRISAVRAPYHGLVGANLLQGKNRLEGCVAS